MEFFEYVHSITRSYLNGSTKGAYNFRLENTMSVYPGSDYPQTQGVLSEHVSKGAIGDMDDNPDLIHLTLSAYFPEPYTYPDINYTHKIRNYATDGKYTR